MNIVTFLSTVSTSFATRLLPHSQQRTSSSIAIYLLYTMFVSLFINQVHTPALFRGQKRFSQHGLKPNTVNFKIKTLSSAGFSPASAMLFLSSDESHEVFHTQLSVPDDLTQKSTPNIFTAMIWNKGRPAIRMAQEYMAPPLTYTLKTLLFKGFYNLLRMERSKPQLPALPQTRS